MTAVARAPRLRGKYKGIPPEPARLAIPVCGSLALPEPQDLAERMAASRFGFTYYERRWVTGQWLCSTKFKPASYWGQYPATFLDRIMTMFPTERLLHLCSGHSHIKGALNIDVLPVPSISVQADAEALPLRDESFAVVLIDPPYSEEDAQRYGVKRLIRSTAVLAEMWRVLVPGGYVVWLDERYPSYRRKNWELCGLIGVVTGFERRARFVSIFRKRGHE